MTLLDTTMRRRIESLDYDVQALYRDLRKIKCDAEDALDWGADWPPELRHAAMVLDHVVQATDGMTAAANRMRNP